MWRFSFQTFSLLVIWRVNILIVLFSLLPISVVAAVVSVRVMWFLLFGKRSLFFFSNANLYSDEVLASLWSIEIIRLEIIIYNNLIERNLIPSNFNNNEYFYLKF